MQQQILSHTPHMDFAVQGRKWDRFVVNQAARIISVSPCLAGLTSRTCHLIDISRGGAGLEVSHTIGLSDHYYLAVAGTNARIGCAEVYRTGNRVGVKFIKVLDEDYLSRIVRGEFFLR